MTGRDADVMLLAFIINSPEHRPKVELHTLANFVPTRNPCIEETGGSRVNIMVVGENY
jgi:hypothetical protein